MPRNPDMKEQIARLEQQVRQLLDWMAAKKQQQISRPLDDASRNNIGALYASSGTSKALTQSKSISSTPTSISVPAAYAGTVFIAIDGKVREIPYL